MGSAAAAPGLISFMLELLPFAGRADEMKHIERPRLLRLTMDGSL
jgi:hypothetical protein